MNIRSGKVILGEIYTKEKNRKQPAKLTSDLIRWAIKNKGSIFYFNLFRLNRVGTDIQDYLTIEEYHKIHAKLNPVYYRPMLEDKIIFDRYVKGFNLPSPEMYGIIENSRVFWLDTKQHEPLESITSRSLHAYCKMVTSYGGKNIFKIDVENGRLLINNEEGKVEDLKAGMGNGKYILQRTIVQHEKLSSLNPSCVNTLRIYTINNGEFPEFFSSALRMGVDNSIVDNVSSNNLVTGIRENSFLQEKAHSGTNPPKWFEVHPNTKVRFGEFEVPFYKEACDLCCNTHVFFNDFFYIAWDIAITKDGPIILEGNPAADLYGPQALFGGLKKQFLDYASQFKSAKLGQ